MKFLKSKTLPVLPSVPKTKDEYLAEQVEAGTVQDIQNVIRARAHQVRMSRSDDIECQPRSIAQRGADGLRWLVTMCQREQARARAAKKAKDGAASVHHDNQARKPNIKVISR